MIRRQLPPDVQARIDAAMRDVTSDRPSPRAQAIIQRVVLLMVSEEGTCAAAYTPAPRSRNEAKLPAGPLDLAQYAAEIYRGGMNQ